MTVLSGKRCLITGATGGLGAALAREFAGRGCRLILTGRNEPILSRVASQLSLHPKEDTFVADLRTSLGLESLLSRVDERFGGLDVLINNAGVFPVGAFPSLSNDEMDQCLDVNLRAPIVLSRGFAPVMVSMGWGRIINIASSSAYAGFANSAVYCASKHALLGLSRALDDELRPKGVRVISISPGSIKTPMGRKVPGQDFETFMEPAEVANVTADVAELDGSLILNEVRLNRMVMG